MNFTLNYFIANSKKKYLLFLFITIILASFLSFWKLSETSVNQWDEARNGINAVEMYYSHDYINLYYDHKPDTWNAKPPLLIWLIVLCYKIFGFGELALRLPSAIAAVVFFIYAFKLISLYEKPAFAFLVCVSLMACKGIIGPHVGRTGDFDALLVCLLTISVYHFCMFTDFGKNRSAILSGFFLGLAFYTKGTASVLLVPGMLIYLLFTRKFKAVFMNRFPWAGIIIYFIAAFSWVVIQKIYGERFSDSVYGSSNVLETMFINDTMQRFFSSAFKWSVDREPLAVLKILDAKINLWNYFFYISVILALLIGFRGKAKPDEHKLFFKNPLITLSFSLFFSLAILLSAGNHVNVWYLAPVLLFAMIITLNGFVYLSSKIQIFNIVFLALLAFTLARHFIYLNTPDRKLKNLMEKERLNISNAEKAYVTGSLPDAFLYFKWYNPNVSLVTSENEISGDRKNFVLFANENFGKGKFKADKTKCFENYCFILNNKEN